MTPPSSVRPETSEEQLHVLAFCDYMQEPMGGGAEIVSTEIYRRLDAEAGFDVHVLSGVVGSGSTPPAGVSVETVRGVDLSRIIGGQLSVAPTLPWRAFRAFRRRRPDVIHASSLHFFGSLVGAAMAALTKVPLVTTCHLSGLDALPPRTRRLASLHEALIGRFILGRSAKVIAVSGAVRDHVVATLGVEPGKVEVVENGVDSERFAPVERSDGRFVVASVGRLIQNKGPLELVEAFRQLDDADAELRIAGTGPLAEAVAEAAAGDDRIKLLGHRSDVPEILGDADVFVRCSTTEGRSLAILEAMAAGCAVVASDIEANAEMIDHDRNGVLVPPGDVGCLALALKRLDNERDRCAALGSQGRADAEASSWVGAALATADVLRAGARESASR